MAKGQKKSGREAKKPKATKVTVAAPSSFLQPRAGKPAAPKETAK